MRESSIVLAASALGLIIAVATYGLLPEASDPTLSSRPVQAPPAATTAAAAAPAPLAGPANPAAESPLPSAQIADVASTGALPLPRTLSPPFHYPDGLTIETPSGAVRLSGLDGPGGDAICLDIQQRPWACGSLARAAIRNLVRKRPVTCQADVQEWTAHCRVENEDIARILVAQGYARPIDEGDSLLAAVMADARAARRGLWNGGWQFR
jgi:endonuclease YncB( thermonuclease family)